MVDFSEEQKLVARALLARPKSPEELREETGVPALRLNEALKALIKLKLVEKQTDNRYKLIDYVLKGVSVNVKGPARAGGETVDEEEYKARFVIDGTSKSREALERQIGMLEERLRGEKNCRIDDWFKSDIAEGQGDFTQFIDVSLTVPAFKHIIYLIVQYGPSSVELLAPEKIELGLGEAQALLNDISSAVHYYVGLVLLAQTQGLKLPSGPMPPSEA